MCGTTQFLRKNGLAVKAQDFASSRNIFPKTGVFVGAMISVLGAISYGGSRRAYVIAEMTLLLSTDLGVSMLTTADGPKTWRQVLHTFSSNGSLSLSPTLNV